MRCEHIESENDFRKNNSMLIVLLPKNGNVHALVVPQKFGNAPIVHDWNGYVVDEYEVNRIVNVVGKPRQEKISEGKAYIFGKFRTKRRQAWWLLSFERSGLSFS